MPHDLLALERFGGMRLDVESMELGAAFAEDARNVRLRERGRLAPRNATAQLGAALSGSTTIKAIAALQGIVVTGESGPDGGIRSIVVATGVEQRVGFPGGTDAGVVAYGGGGVEAVYGVIAGSGNLYKVLADGTISVAALPANITNPTRIGKIAYLPDSNRLVVTDAVAGASNAVWFFEPESDTAVEATNFVNLHPGVDRIRDAIVWERQLVISKGRQLFFFGPPSVDSTGEPVFDYRVLELGEASNGEHRICAGRDGVYIGSARGVYVTRGGAPALVSTAVQPLFDAFESGAKLPTLGKVTAVKGIAAHEDYIYVGCEAATPYTLLYDERAGEWTYDSYYMQAGVATSQADDGFVFIAVALGATTVQLLSSDNPGSPATPNYRSGWYEPREGALTVLRRSVLAGAGTVTLKQAVDGAALDAGSSVVLGSVAAPVRAPRNVAKRGRQHQFQISGNGVWSVHRVEHHVGQARRPSVETP